MRNIFIAIVVLFAVIINSSEICSQNTIHSSDWNPKGRIYKEEWLKSVESSSNRELKIRVIGPKDIKDQGSFYLEILPGTFVSNTNNRTQVTITDINLKLIVSEGFMDFSPRPIYKVMTAKSMEIIPVVDKAGRSREISKYLSGALHSLFKCIPVVGGVMSLGENLELTNKLHEANERDWDRIWESRGKTDVYPILKPVHSKPLDWEQVRAYYIELPFKRHGTKGKLDLYIDYIAAENNYNRNDKSLFKNHTINIIDKGNRLDKRNLLVENNYEHKNEFEVPGAIAGIKINFMAEIYNRNNQNFLEISCEPVARNNLYAHLHDMNISLEFKKSSGEVSGMPTYYNYKGDIVPFQSIKKQLRKKVIANWVTFGIGFIPVYGSIISGASEIENITESYDEAVNSISFSQTMKNLWENENNINFYQLPPFENSCAGFQGHHGFKVQIPVSFYDKNIDLINVFFQFDLHYGVTESTNRITTASIRDNTFRNSFKIPMKFKRIGKIKNTSNTFGFIIDSSGSMEKNDPNDIRKAALEIILRNISRDDNVFIVDFDSGAKCLNRDSWKNWRYQELRRLVKYINSSGGTNIGAGIDCMRNNLVKNLSGNIRGGVLLLTDGIGKYSKEAEWFRDKGIPIHTISLVGEDNGELLRRISSVTNGKYLKAHNAGDIISRFQQFYNSFLNGNGILQISNTINQDEVQKHSFNLDSSINGITSSITWEGSKIGLKLISPTGQEYNENNSEQWIEGNNYIYVKVAEPEAGKWYALLKGLEIEPSGEHFKMDINAITSETFSFNIDKSRSSFDEGTIHAIFDTPASAQFENRSLKAFVINPNLDTLDISSNFKNNRLYFTPMGGKGSYEIVCNYEGLNIKGEKVQRSFYESFYLGEFNPSNRAAVSEVLSINYLQAPIGRNKGNRSGLPVNIYKKGSNRLIAKGMVINVKERHCLLKVKNVFTLDRVEIGDLIEVDPKFWMND